MKCKNCGEPIHKATKEELHRLGPDSRFDHLIGNWKHQDMFGCLKNDFRTQAEPDLSVEEFWEDGSPVHTDDDLIQAYSRQFDNGV